MPASGSGTIPWPGGKTKMASWITSNIPQHQTYVEVFGGGASTLMEKDESNLEIYNDLDNRLVEFFEVCRDEGDRLSDWLRETPYSRGVFERYRRCWANGNVPDSKFERAAQFFYLQAVSYGSKGGTFATQTKPCTFRPGSNNTPRRYRSIALNPSRIQSRFSEVIIEQLDYAELIPKYDSDATFFYCDPPYYNCDYYRHGSDFDHESFANLLSQCEGWWMVSYAELPPAFDRGEWTIKEHDQSWGLSHDAETEQVERIVMNYDPDTTPLFAESGQRTLSEVA